MKQLHTPVLSRIARRAGLALLLALAVTFATAAAPDAEAAPATRTLGRSFIMLEQKKALNVGYFGGSITAGSGASNGAKTSYRALTTQWLREQYPQATITEIDAAIGGTGSNLGAFRCQQDLLSQNPDLVFVEFAVNDGGAAVAPAQRAMEGIVRQIWRANPHADIVFLYTTGHPHDATYARGELPSAVRHHHAVAAHYGIPELNIGKALLDEMAQTKQPWEHYFKDAVHPADPGYRVYFETIRKYLEAQRNAPAAPAVTLGEPLVKNPLERGRLVDAWTLAAPGWTKENKPMSGRCPHMLVSNQPGAELTIKFTGTAVGLYWLIAPDSGDIEWSLDGAKPRRQSSWDKYALKFSRANYAVLGDNLAPGAHELKLKVLGQHPAQSKGDWIRIGALMVN